MNIKEGEVINAITTKVDINTMIGNLQNPSVYQFLSNLGESLIDNNCLLTDQSPLEQLSKDLNIKIMVYSGPSLYIETFSYEFRNPIIVYIYVKISNEKVSVPYLFHPNDRIIFESVISIDSSKMKKLNQFGMALIKIKDSIYVKQGFLKWLKFSLKRFQIISTEFSLVRVSQDIKERAGQLPSLKTSKMNISDLKYCKSYIVKFPEFFTKFVPVPDLNIVEENRKAGIKPEADSDEEFVADDDEDDDDQAEPELPDGNIPIWDPETNTYFTPAVGPDPSSGPAPGQGPVPGPGPAQGQNFGGFPGSGQGMPSPNVPSNPPPGPRPPHCEECESNPITEITLKCKCQLSQNCLFESYSGSSCIGCNKALTPQDIQLLRSLFD